MKTLKKQPARQRGMIKLHKNLRTARAHYTIGFVMMLLAVCTICGCSTSEPMSRTALFFDTYVTITIYDKDVSPDILDDCFDRAEYFETCFSPTLKDSDVCRINENAGSPVTVHPETADLIRTALTYCALSDGKIDITIEPVSRLWDFSSQGLSAGGDDEAQVSGHHAVPDARSISALLPHVDYRNVNVSGSTVTLTDPDAGLSLGFIAKGYIADDLKTYLISQGVEHALINLGGNILAIGGKPDGSPFRIGIQKPFDRQGESITTVTVHGMSLVSSGIYERYFEENGRIYHHILDPATGFPVENELYSVTILSASSTAGDALSTTCYALGLEKGMALIEMTDGVEALFITSDYKVHKSSGFE